MHIVVVGMNHTTANVELRERVSLDDAALERVLTQLRESRTVMESVVLSTCNRTEIYALVSSVRAGQDYLATVIASEAGIEKPQIEAHTYIHQGERAVNHAMRVAAGLDSIVIGETQILGQMRTAFQTAFEVGNTGAMFNRLFREVLHVGKRAQTETGVGQTPVSVSYAAVQLASKVYGDMRNKSALVIGAGHMGQLALQHLAAQGVQTLFLANRSRGHAEAVAAMVGAQVEDLGEIPKLLESVDVVISATSAPGYTVSASDVSGAFQARRGRSMVMLDIAMPRDLDPSIANVGGIYLYDVDDLDGVIEANLQERKRQGAIVEEMITDAVNVFSNWLSEQEVVPLISALRMKGQSVQQEVMDSLRHKLPELSERDVKILNKHTMSIVNQLLREPIQNVKELAIASGDAEYVYLFAHLFGIEETLAAETKTSQPAGTFVELFQRMRGIAMEGQTGRETRTLHPVLR